MPRRINKIEMVCFRGATRKSSLEFDDKKPIVFLFGENGTGKSTIVDAIDLVTNQKLGSLENRSLGKRGKANYLPAAGKTAADMKICIEMDGNTWQAVVDGTRIQTVPDKNIPDVRILRRAHLAQLVEAEPAERYRVLQRFIDVTEIEKCENSLRDEHRVLNTDLNTASTILADASQALEDLWNKEGKPGSSPEKWAESKEGLDKTELENRHTSLSNLLNKTSNLTSIISTYISAAEDKENAETNLVEIEAEIESAPSIEGKTGVDLIELLQITQTYLEKASELNTCPVCKQPVKLEDLKAELAQRIAGMSAHKDLAEKRIQGKKLAERAKGACEKSVEALLEAFQATIDASVEPTITSKIPTTIASTAEVLKKDAIGAFEMVKAIGEELAILKGVIQKEVDSIRADIEKHNGIVTNLARVRDNRKKAEELNVLVERTKTALDICEKERKAFTQEVLDDVSDEIGRLFRELHPDEPIGDIKLELKRRASIDQSARFGDQSGVPPQAYYSDSHLDTLGFCVWLALAKRGDPSERIIVFDDLFTSIDSAHHSRILKLIIKESDAFAQTFLTTHSRSLFNRPRKLGAAAGKMDLIELHRWNLTRGIAATTRLIYIDEICELLKKTPFHRQEISSQAGILLESVLDDLAELYERRLPRNKANEYTLGALLDGCEKLAKVLERETDGIQASAMVDGKGPIQVAFEKLREVEFIRNVVGCHHNPVGDEISDPEVENFGRFTVDLVEALICPECKEIPWRRDMSHFSCSCKKTRLKPLEFKK